MNRNAIVFLGIVVFASSSFADPSSSREDSPVAWPPHVEQALLKAKENRPELVKALTSVPKEQRDGMIFLVANMPEGDLQTLRADFLLENVEFAFKAKVQFPWAKPVPEAIFRNNVLPYANLDESRDPWRRDLFDLCAPVVRDCLTASEAATRLNSVLFNELKVRYSKKRKKPSQSPKESIEQGLASCTGLSILLVDACRSVGIPARVVGTAALVDDLGNHSWVEIWDGDWHFTGACEADPKGLDHGWFEWAASKARKDAPMYAVYAASFQKSAASFPLIWATDRKDVPAENVTDRYTKRAIAKNTKTTLAVRVWDGGQGKRLALPIVVKRAGTSDPLFEGTAKGEQDPLNRCLTFDLVPGSEYVIQVGKPVLIEQAVKASDGIYLQFLDIEVPAQNPVPPQGKRPNEPKKP